MEPRMCRARLKRQNKSRIIAPPSRTCYGIIRTFLLAGAGTLSCSPILQEHFFLMETPGWVQHRGFPLDVIRCLQRQAPQHNGSPCIALSRNRENAPIIP